MKHFIIGTAGHVDHGKTMLIKSLTGKETDRLKEEKERGISIELGFAPFMLPSGMLAGVVDVPGHERFIKNMLAGVGGMDLVLLVVAADEGIMPQTREHLHIIDLLGIPEGIIVLTKVDLVEDEWLEMVKEEVAELAKGTVLEKAPFAEVSSVSGQGIAELTCLIDDVAGKLRERSVGGQARMPVDRIFTITGFGTVVTGTLTEGKLAIGETVEILPEGIQARIRGLQVHGEKQETAEAGQRVAVNLAGTEREKIERGSVLAAPGLLTPSHRLDIQVKLLADVGKSLINRARVRVHIGTAEILARVILLGIDELEPGETAYAQLECEEPMVSTRGDRLVIRSYSPMRTIGGGTVIEPLPTKHKRFDGGVIDALKTKEKGTPEELLEQFISDSKQLVFTRDELAKGSGLADEVAKTSIEELVSHGKIRRFSGDNRIYLVLNTLYGQKAAEMKNSLEKFHHSFPLRAGMSKEEIRSKHLAGLNSKLFNFLMDLYQQEGIIRVVGENISTKDFEPQPGVEQKEMFQKIEDIYLNGGFQTPGWDDISSMFKLNQVVAEEILSYFVNKNCLVKLEEGVLIHRFNLDRARNITVDFLKQKGEMSLGEARDLFSTSRKYALPIMNYLDKEKVTRRVEDKRVLY